MLAKTKTVIISAHRMPAGMEPGNVLILDHGRSVDSLPLAASSPSQEDVQDLGSDTAELSDDDD
jgi:hypothetical protein